jgi:hypothetical protein
MKDQSLNLRNPAALSALARGDIHNTIVAGTPGGIEAQETAGQAMLTLKFNQLPKEGFDRYGQILDRLGFVAGKDIDELFVSITPPTGWTLRPSDHSMRSYIHDDQGRKRGAVFYKAAFYDRRANFYLTTRYTAGGDYRGEDYKNRYSNAKDTATGQILFERGPFKEYSDQDEADKAACSYLDNHHPEWRSVEAYW